MPLRRSTSWANTPVIRRTGQIIHEIDVSGKRKKWEFDFFYKKGEKNIEKAMMEPKNSSPHVKKRWDAGELVDDADELYGRNSQRQI